MYDKFKFSQNYIISHLNDFRKSCLLNCIRLYLKISVQYFAFPKTNFMLLPL